MTFIVIVLVLALLVAAIYAGLKALLRIIRGGV